MIQLYKRCRELFKVMEAAGKTHRMGERGNLVPSPIMGCSIKGGDDSTQMHRQSGDSPFGPTFIVYFTTTGGDEVAVFPGSLRERATGEKLRGKSLETMENRLDKLLTANGV